MAPLCHTVVLTFPLGADVKTGSVFCLECDDIVVDETFESLFHSTTLHVEEKETKFICELTFASACPQMRQLALSTT